MSYAIQNENGDHLGFLLMSDKNDIRDCIFRSLPIKSNLFESKESEILFNYQELGEFQWNKTIDGIEIKHPKTGNNAFLSDGKLTINNAKFNIVQIQNF